MDFFEAQARAKKRTSRLVLLFVVAVAGTIVAGYAAALTWVLQIESRRREGRDDFRLPPVEAGPARYWRPQVFLPVALGTLAVVGIGSLYKWLQFRGGGAAVAESVGARRVSPQTTNQAERRLLNVVEEMAIASGVPVPAVYLLDDESAINAFAAGFTTHDAVVAVTRGTLEKLTRDELQGVVGHEFSHILNGDMRLNVRLSAIIFGILLIGLIGRTILDGLSRIRLSSRSDRKGAGPVIGIFALGLALLLIGYLGYFFGRMIQSAVSRQREFLADASAVQFTRNPAGLTGALRKIGGYALGSTITSTKSAAIGHFFFAQGFRSMLDSIWATHPPLEERIRAIDPQFDGKMFAVPEVVDIGRESFVSAGLAPALASPPPSLPPPRIPFGPTAATRAVAAIGSLSAEQIANSRLLLESVPATLREASRAPGSAPALVYGLLLAPEPAVRAKQRDLVATHAGATAREELERLEPALQRISPEQRLPLFQLTLPVLRGIPTNELSAFLETLDELVHADSEVSTFEFALQKLLVHTLALGKSPGSAVVQFHSFQALAQDIGVVLSALARASSVDPAFAPQAFLAGAAQVPLIAARLQFLPPGASGMEQLDAALDRLAVASGAIKQRTLIAAAHTVGADGRILVSEAELLRAIAAALDCPMPPLTGLA